MNDKQKLIQLENRIKLLEKQIILLERLVINGFDTLPRVYDSDLWHALEDYETFNN